MIYANISLRTFLYVTKKKLFDTNKRLAQKKKKVKKNRINTQPTVFLLQNISNNISSLRYCIN